MLTDEPANLSDRMRTAPLASGRFSRIAGELVILQ
jgi:hypothetical protein